MNTYHAMTDEPDIIAERSPSKDVDDDSIHGLPEIVQRAYKLKLNGHSREVVAKELKVSARSVSRYWRQWEKAHAEELKGRPRIELACEEISSLDELIGMVARDLSNIRRKCIQEADVQGFPSAGTLKLYQRFVEQLRRLLADRRDFKQRVGVLPNAGEDAATELLRKLGLGDEVKRTATEERSLDEIRADIVEICKRTPKFSNSQ